VLEAQGKLNLIFLGAARGIHSGASAEGQAF
jgi:hypothetical protein